MVNMIAGRDWDEEIPITLTREQWWEISGAIGHDVFEGQFNEVEQKIYEIAFPPREK